MARARTRSVAAERSEPPCIIDASVDAATQISLDESRAAAQQLEEEAARWENGTDGNTKSALVVSLFPKYAPPPVATAAHAPKPASGAAPLPPPSHLSEQQALDEEWGEWHGGHSDGDKWSAFSCPHEGHPPQPALLAVLHELAALHTTAPLPVTPAGVVQTRIRRVGFAEEADHARPPGDPLGVICHAHLPTPRS